MVLSVPVVGHADLGASVTLGFADKVQGTIIEKIGAAMTGAWTLDPDTGEFTLNEPYATQLAEAKRRASAAWQRTIYDYLAANSKYTTRQIHNEFSRRVNEESLSPIEIVDEFIIEALEGNLL